MVGPVARLLPLGKHVKRFPKDRLSQLGNELDQIEASCPGFDPASTRVSWSWPGLAGELDAPNSISLSAMASPTAHESGPLVTLVRRRTVAKVDSNLFVVRRSFS